MKQRHAVGSGGSHAGLMTAGAAWKFLVDVAVEWDVYPDKSAARIEGSDVGFDTLRPVRGAPGVRPSNGRAGHRRTVRCRCSLLRCLPHRPDELDAALVGRWVDEWIALGRRTRPFDAGDYPLHVHSLEIPKGA